MAIGLLGATGLVGGGVGAALQGPVIALGRGVSAERSLDLANVESMTSSVWADIDCLVHCAGVTDEEVQADAEAAYHRASYAMTRLVDSAHRAGVTRFVYVSSAHVYGPLEGRIDETKPVDPRTDYAIAHSASEQIFRRAALRDGVEALIVRPCAVYGFPSNLARFRRFGLIPFGFPKMAAEQGRIALRSRGDQVRNFVSTAMIGRRIAAFLSGASEAGRCLVENALGPDDLSVVDFANLCCERYRQLTGAACKVTQGEGEAAAKPFFYCSLRDNRDKPSELVPFLDEIITRLRS